MELAISHGLDPQTATLNFFVLSAAGFCHAHLFLESIHAWVILAGLYSSHYLYLAGLDFVSGVGIFQESDSEAAVQSCHHQGHNYLSSKAVYDLCEEEIDLFDRYHLEAETVRIFQTVGMSHLLRGDLARRICIGTSVSRCFNVEPDVKRRLESGQ